MTKQNQKAKIQLNKSKPIKVDTTFLPSVEKRASTHETDSKRSCVTPDEITQILNLKYTQHKSYKTLSTQFNVSEYKIKAVIKKYGIEYKKRNKIYDKLPSVDDLIKHWDSKTPETIK